MSKQKGLTLIEYLYSGNLNGELFFDQTRKMKYHVEEVFGDVLNLGLTVIIVKYENGKSKFINLYNHLNDLIFEEESILNNV